MPDQPTWPIEKAIVHCCHHKTGTVWFQKIFTDIAADYGIPLHLGKLEEMPAETKLALSSSRVTDLGQLPPHVGTHMIRDPRDVMISGCHYHMHSSEPWLNEPREHLGGKTYRETISAMSFDDALLFEMEHIGADTIQQMADWNYDNPAFLELKYEEVILAQDEWFPRIFDHYGFPREHHERLMAAVRNNSFGAKENRRLGEEKSRSHQRSGKPKQWADAYTDAHKAHFKKLHGATLIALGYEADMNW